MLLLRSFKSPKPPSSEGLEGVAGVSVWHYGGADSPRVRPKKVEFELGGARIKHFFSEQGSAPTGVREDLQVRFSKWSKYGHLREGGR